MNLRFRNKKITGLLVVIPKNEVRFDDEYPESKKLAKVMSYNTRRIVKEGVCTSDLCVNGLEYLLKEGLLKREEINALVLVTQSPDYFMPPTSNVIQGRLGLKRDIICMDINQGCAGFIIGLIQSFMLLEHVNKVVLLNADILSRKVSKRDRNSNPIVGDAASITIIENTPSEIIHANIKMEYSDALIIPAGGFRLPSSERTTIPQQDGENYRSKDNLYMKGDEVFNFVQKEVPPMIEDLLKESYRTKAEIDYFVFHQPNRFMLNKLADKLDIPYLKMPSNVVENFGNASGVTIPTCIAYNMIEGLVCLAGFGVGLTWGSMILNLKLDFCKIIEI